MTVTHRPEFTEGAETMRQIAENSPVGTNIGVELEATDPDSTALKYELTGIYVTRFDFATSSRGLQLKTRTILDHEDRESYSVIATVADEEGDANRILVRVSVLDVDETGTVGVSTTTTEVGTTVTATLGDPDDEVGSISWQWQRLISTQTDGTTRWEVIADETSPEYTTTSDDIMASAATGTIRAVASYEDFHGPGKRVVSPDIIVSKRSLPLPSNFDVEPLALRKARLRWDDIANLLPDISTVSYLVEIREDNATSAWKYQVDGDVSSSHTAEPHFSVDLDGVLVSATDIIKGMADEEGYQYRVKATDPSGVYLDSGFSDGVVIIRDNPLLQSQGIARGDGGVATLKWSTPSDPGLPVLDYSISFRKLGRDHSDRDWPEGLDWPYPVLPTGPVKEVTLRPGSVASTIV